MGIKVLAHRKRRSVQASELNFLAVLILIRARQLTFGILKISYKTVLSLDEFHSDCGSGDKSYG